ncbi:hypothetical protein AKJ16_DCAP00116, partial [Drosera capensis]
GPLSFSLAAHILSSPPRFVSSTPSLSHTLSLKQVKATAPAAATAWELATAMSCCRSSTSRPRRHTTGDSPNTSATTSTAISTSIRYSLYSPRTRFFVAVAYLCLKFIDTQQFQRQVLLSHAL